MDATLVSLGIDSETKNPADFVKVLLELHHVGAQRGRELAEALVTAATLAEGYLIELEHGYRPPADEIATRREGISVLLAGAATALDMVETIEGQMAAHKIAAEKTWPARG